MKTRMNMMQAVAAVFSVAIMLFPSSVFAGRLTTAEVNARYDAVCLKYGEEHRKNSVAGHEASVARHHETISSDEHCTCPVHQKNGTFRNAGRLRGKDATGGVRRLLYTGDDVGWDNPWVGAGKAIRKAKANKNKPIWKKPIMSGGVDPYLFDSPQVFNGYLAMANETGAEFKGTIQVKFESVDLDRKQGSVAAKAKAVIEVAGRKKVELEGRLEVDASGNFGSVVFMSKKGMCLVLDITNDRMDGELICKNWGTMKVMENYTIIGARDLFESADVGDHMRLATYLKKWETPIVLAWKSDPYAGKDAKEGAAVLSRYAGWNVYSVVVGARGKVKVRGHSVEGVRSEQTAQLIVAGDGTCYVPIVVNEKGTAHAFNLVLPEEGAAHVWGPVEAKVAVAKRGAMGESIVFSIDEGYPLWNQLEGGFAYTEYLPMEMEIFHDGEGVWGHPDSGKVVLNNLGLINKKKLGANPSGLSVSYQKADGTFKGTFKVYVNKNGWPKAVPVQVYGVMVDGAGYGTATVKDVGSVPITIVG